MSKITIALIATVSTVFGVMVCIPTTHAEIIFGDHFDSQPDWNSSQSAESLSGWSGDQTNNRGGAYEAGYISAAGAHGGSGKGFIQYWDQTSSMGSAQDIWLYKRNINFTNEWYLGYWFQVDPRWDWGSAANLKLLKVHFDNGQTWDIFWTAFCAGCPDYNVPSGTIRSLCTDEWGRNWAGSWNDLGSSWHYFIWHFNHSTGTLELSMDGNPVMKTENPTNYPGSGWDSNYGISFGGNITDGGGGLNEMWTKYDDVVIATTQSEVESFLGVSNSGEPTPEPVPPNEVSVLVSETFDDNNLANRGWYDGGSRTATLVNDSERSSNVLELTYLAGDSNSQLGQIRHLFTESDEVTVNYNVKYSSNWSWTGYTYGPHEFYLLTNADHDYKGPAYSHSTFYIEMTGGHPRIAHQDGMNVDTAYINQDISSVSENRAVAGCNGSADGYQGGCYESGGNWYNGRSWASTSATVLPNRWYAVKAYFRMNDIVNGKGVANGVVKYWLDGELIMSYENVIFRTAQNAAMRFKQIMIAPYFHNGAPHDQKFWIDDVVVQNSDRTSVPVPQNLRLMSP